MRKLWQKAAVERALKEIDNGATPVDHDRIVAWIESWDTESELPRPR